MESFQQREEASELLDAIADAEVGTYLPPEQQACAPVPIAERVLRVIASIVGLVAIGWLLSRDAWWGVPLGLAMSLGFVLAMTRLEQRHTNVRPKLSMPRHVFWRSLRENWAVNLLIFVATPPIIWFLNSEPRFWTLVFGVVVYLAAGVLVGVFVQRARQRREVNLDD